jgi:hypothetical protein
MWLIRFVCRYEDSEPDVSDEGDDDEDDGGDGVSDEDEEEEEEEEEDEDEGEEEGAYTIFFPILFHSLNFLLHSFYLSVPLPNSGTTGPPAAKKQKTAPASKDEEGAEKKNGTNGTAKTSAPAEEAVKVKGGDVPKESAQPEVEEAEEAEE